MKIRISLRPVFGRWIFPGETSNFSGLVDTVTKVDRVKTRSFTLAYSSKTCACLAAFFPIFHVAICCCHQFITLWTLVFTHFRFSCKSEERNGNWESKYLAEIPYFLIPTQEHSNIFILRQNVESRILRNYFDNIRMVLIVDISDSGHYFISNNFIFTLTKGVLENP